MRDAEPTLGITSAQAVLNDTNYDVKVQLSTEATGKVVVALYDDHGVLIDMQSKTITNSNATEIQLPYSDTMKSAKAFLWGDLTGMTPLCKAKPVTFN